MTTTLKTSMLALLTASLTAAASVGVSLEPVPQDLVDVEGVHVNQDPSSSGALPEWLRGWYRLDTIGADFTFGTSGDPVADELDPLRDAELASAQMDADVRTLQTKQRGWFEGSLEMSYDATGQGAAIVVEPGRGWFPSLPREAGEAWQGESTRWTPRTVGAVEEAFTITWTPGGAACPIEDRSPQTVDALRDDDPAGRRAVPGQADQADPNGLVGQRNDRVAFFLNDGAFAGCTIDVVFDFALEFVHEGDGGDIQTAGNVGYMRSPSLLMVCRSGFDATALDCPDAERFIAEDPVDVLYAPVFPLGYAIAQCEALQLVPCLEEVVQQRPAPAQGVLDVVDDGTELVVVAFDQAEDGFTTMQLFGLDTYTHQSASGPEDGLTLS